MKEVFPVQILLEQWLLLPLFADVGLIILVLRATRGRVGVSLSALLSVLALWDLATIWPAAPASPPLLVICESLLPASVTAFTLSYAGGRMLRGDRIWRILMLLVPPAGIASLAFGTGLAPDDAILPAYSLAFFAANISYLVLSGSAGTLNGDEPVLFGAGITTIIVSGPIFGLLLPGYGLNLPLFPYLSAAAGALFAWAVLRYKAFPAIPAAEDALPGGERTRPGVFLERRGDAGHARSLLVGEVMHGRPGIIMTRAHPLTVRRRSGLERTPVVWLAQSSYERSLPPGRPELLSHLLRDMGEQCPDCMALVEDLDYLISNAGFYPVLDTLKGAQEVCARTGMTVILSSNLLTDEERSEIRWVGIPALSDRMTSTHENRNCPDRTDSPMAGP